MEKIFKGNNLWKSIGLSVSLVFCACFSNAAKTSCPTAGATQNKYTASGCSYTTQTRTCCSDKYWTDFGGSCKDCSTVPSGYSLQVVSGQPYCLTSSNHKNCLYNCNCNSYDGWSFSLKQCGCDSGYTACSDGLCKETLEAKTSTITVVHNRYAEFAAGSCSTYCTTGIGKNQTGVNNIPWCNAFPNGSINTNICNTCDNPSNVYVCITGSSGRFTSTEVDSYGNPVSGGWGKCNCTFSLKGCLGTSTTMPSGTYDL